MNDDRNKEKESSSALSIRVEIYNQTYNIRSFDGDGEYIIQLAEYVDGKMREIASKTLTVDSLKVAILAALQIADDLHRLKTLHDKADEELAARSGECAEMLDRLLKQKTSEVPNSDETQASQKSDTQVQSSSNKT